MNKEQFRQQGIEIRKDFPLFNSADVVYLDNAATSQKPECVIPVSYTHLTLPTIA